MHGEDGQKCAILIAIKLENEMMHAKANGKLRETPHKKCFGEIIHLRGTRPSRKTLPMRLKVMDKARNGC